MHKKLKQEIYSLFSIRGKCSSAGEQGSVLVVVSWEDKYRHSWHPIFLILSPSFHYWAWCHTVSIIALVNLGQLSWTACVQPFSSLMGQQEKQKHPWLCVSISQQKIQYQCYYYFHQQSKTRHCKSCYEKKLSQPEPWQQVIFPALVHQCALHAALLPKQGTGIGWR